MSMEQKINRELSAGTAAEQCTKDDGLHVSPDCIKPNVTCGCGQLGKYSIIHADPPWRYNDKSLNRGGAERHYKTMGIEEIKAIPVNEIAADNSILFMWATFPKLQEGLDTIKAWGFEFKTCAFVWVKTNKRTNVMQTSFLPADSFDNFWGMGRWTRSNAEICLLAIKGKPQRLNADVHQIIYAPIDKHSKKPPETREKILRLCGDLPRLEMFARNAPDGWDVFGNEIENSIELKFGSNRM